MDNDDLRIALLRQRELFGTEREMARELGVSRQDLNAFTNGRRYKAERTNKIHRALGVEVVLERTKDGLARVLKPKVEL